MMRSRLGAAPAWPRARCRFALPPRPTLCSRWRRVAPLHSRFMLCTQQALVDPVLARLLYF
jgi:hypothetical protein